MKASIIGLSALFVQAALCRVVPVGPRNPGHAQHKNGHNKRDMVTSFTTQTDIVTVTDYNAVVIVDEKGVVLTTVYNTDPSTIPPSVPAVTASSSIITAAAPLVTTSPSSLQVSDSAVPATSINTPPVDPPAVLSSLLAGATSGIASISSVASPIVSAVVSPSPSIANHGTTSSGNKAGTLAGFSIGYDPISSSGCRDAAADFPFLASQGVGMIRVYDIGCDLSTHVTAAAASNIKLMIGLNGISNLNNDLNTLIGMITKSPSSWGPVDTVYIGNELVNGGASSQDVANAVSTARAILSGKGFNGNVVTVDTFNKMATDPVICSTSSYCAINAHSFFDPNCAATGAGSFVRTSINSVANANGGKRVVITETGWPTQGSTNGQAIPSVGNQKIAIDSILQEFSGNARDIFLFQAYNANYKASGQFGVEPFWGLFDSGVFSG